MPAFEQRIAAAFAHLVELRTAIAGPLAVVSHGLVVKALLMGFARRRHDDQHLPIRMRNCSLSILGYTAPFEIELLDCTAHLTGDLIEPTRSLSGG